MKDIQKLNNALVKLCTAPAFSDNKAAEQFAKGLQEAVKQNKNVFNEIAEQRVKLAAFEESLATAEMQKKLNDDAEFKKEMADKHLALAAPIVFFDLAAMASYSSTGAGVLKQSAEVAKAFGLEAGEIYSDAKLTLMADQSNILFDTACYLPFSSVAALGKVEISRKSVAMRIRPIKLKGEGDPAEQQIINPTIGEKIGYTLIGAHVSLFNYFQDKSFATDLNTLLRGLRIAMVEGEIKALWEAIIIKPKLEHAYQDYFPATGNDTASDLVNLRVWNAIENLNKAAMTLRAEYEKEVTAVTDDLKYTAPSSMPIIVYYNEVHHGLITAIQRVSTSDTNPAAPVLNGSFQFVNVRMLPAGGAAIIDTSKDGRNGKGTDMQGFDAFKPAYAELSGAGVMMVIASPYNIFGIGDPAKLGTQEVPAVQAQSWYIHARLFVSMMKNAKIVAKITPPASAN